MAGKANGEICEKHPQLDGLRYLPARTCVGCVKANSKRLYRERTVLMPQQIARLTAERDALQALLTAADERADVLEGLLRTSLVAMSRIYSAGRDFIVGAGSDCDSVELMMENDPTAREIRAALKPATDVFVDPPKGCDVCGEKCAKPDDGRTPWEVLWDAEAGDEEAFRIWRESKVTKP